MSTYEEIISAALSLPPGTRAMLAEHLLESLDAEDQKRIDVHNAFFDRSFSP